ncbi:hypothetical protein IWW36_001634 [Coemansia brasiliensis]|uniref:RNI-like protein n=1 Tax=Coemansia brasiliensis TaxID=2650707 RepID=A0A9W8M1B8_9FUNG|nr:hypothetical protein IWW36_001634 [Coemansia brasiliensis]
MPRPTRRHARKASATTAEEILLPAELMAGLTSTLSPSEPLSHDTTSTADPLSADTGSTTAEEGHSESANDPITPAGLELAPLFPLAQASSANEDTALSTGEDTQLGSSNDANNDAALNESTAEPKSILKEPRTEDSNGSRWSLWPGAKKWLSGTLMLNARDERYPTFDLGAGIPAGRQNSEDDAAAAAAAALNRTAPSLDFERSTNFVPPLSQERIKSTEFWTNFALELDPSRLKRIRFSMPLIITEFDPEHSRVCDTDDPLLTSLETTTKALRNCLDRDDAIESCDESESTNEDSEQHNSLADSVGGIDHDDGQHITESQNSNSSRSSTSIHSIQPVAWQQHPLQWDVEALSHRQYRVQEVWEIYERTCRAFDIEPLSSFEKILLQHVREDQVLGSINLAGSDINGVHMSCFAEMLDLNFGLVRLELSHCSIDDDAARVLAYSLLCNDSVQYLSVAHNTRLRSDGVRYISILVRHSKQLKSLDISGIAIRKKSAGYLAAALAGLGANWSFGRGSMHKKDTAYEQISLRVLQMNSCGLKPAALAILASGVRLSPLQHLSLRLNSLGASAGPILREMLFGDPPQKDEQSQPHQHRPISVSLHGLSDAQLASDPHAQPPGTAGDSPRVSQLRSLDLSQNDLGRAALDLAEGLLWNTNLRSLMLRQNKLQPAIFAPFIECLGVNRGLVYLDISRNPVCGPETAVLEVLSQVIGQNQSLRGLFMSATAMTSEGAIALAECLPDLHNLERLDVSENPGIDVAGLMALSASIKLNKSLICVEITVNTGDDVCAALEQSIAQVCIANMQRLDTANTKSSDIELDISPQAVHVWTHADFAPESDIPGVVATKVSSENDRYECTSLVTDIAAVKRTSIASTNDTADQS